MHASVKSSVERGPVKNQLIGISYEEFQVYGVDSYLLDTIRIKKCSPMPIKKPLNKKSSNLASEFYVASLLFRLGYEASLTLGNTKEIDLMVYDPETKKQITIDVKGLKNKTNFPVPNKPSESENHFFVLVAYKNRFSDVDSTPDVYVIPSKKVKELWTGWSGKPDKKAIRYSVLRNHPEFKGTNGMRLLFQ